MGRNSLVFWLVVIFGLIFACWGVWYLNEPTHINDIRSDIQEFGPLAPTIFILVTAISGIIPPISTTIFWILGILLFGPIWGFVYSYSAGVLANLISYWISLTWGKDLVVKLFGQRMLEKINKYAKVTKPTDYLILKVFSGIVSDYVGYLAGLSKIDSVSVFLISAIGCLPMMVLGFVMLSVGFGYGVVTGAFSVALFYGISYLTTIFAVPYFLHLRERTKPN